MAAPEYYYDDEFSLDEEQFPMQRAEAAAMLAEEMRREEEALTTPPPAPMYQERGIPWSPPPAPISSPGPTMADLRSQYNAAVSERDDTAALAAMRQIEAARGGDPGSIIRVQTQVPYEIPSPAQQQYEAQQAYQSEIDRGIPPDVAWNRHGPMIMLGQTGKGAAAGKTPTPQLRDIAGVAYAWNPADLSLTQLTPPSTKPSSWEESDRSERTENNKRIAKIREALDKYRALPEKKTEDFDEMNRLIGEANKLSKRNQELASKYKIEPPSSVSGPEERRIGGYTIRKIQR